MSVCLHAGASVLSCRLAARRQDAGSHAEQLQRLEAEFDWIGREKANFGRGE